jgi:hypothetical protein
MVYVGVQSGNIDKVTIGSGPQSVDKTEAACCQLAPFAQPHIRHTTPIIGVIPVIFEINPRVSHTRCY